MDSNNDLRASSAYQALTTHALAGFRFLGWINGIAALVLLAFSLGIIGADVDPPDLQRPIAAYALGLIASATGMLLSYLAHISLFRQMAAGRRARGHWLPMLLGIFAYGLGAVAFMAGCWMAATLGGDALHDDVAFSIADERASPLVARAASLFPTRLHALHRTE